MKGKNFAINDNRYFTIFVSKPAKERRKLIKKDGAMNAKNMNVYKNKSHRQLIAKSH